MMVRSILQLDAGSSAAAVASSNATVQKSKDASAVVVDEQISERTGEILRFRKSERLLHWSIAVPFILCFASGVILYFFYDLHSARPFRDAFAWLHRISGAGLIVFPLLTAVKNRNDYRIHLYNIRQAWIWAVDDMKWLALMGAAALSKKISLPEQGKFNAAEKLNFMMVMCTYPVFIVTGVLLWMPGIAFVSWVVHVAMAALAAPLMLGHMYMATINPSTRVGLKGMITGYVDRRWAFHHYARWFRENFSNRAGAAAEPDQSRPAASPPIRAASVRAGSGTARARGELAQESSALGTD